MWNRLFFTFPHRNPNLSIHLCIIWTICNPTTCFIIYNFKCFSIFSFSSLFLTLFHFLFFSSSSSLPLRFHFWFLLWHHRQRNESKWSFPKLLHSKQTNEKSYKYLAFGKCWACMWYVFVATRCYRPNQFKFIINDSSVKISILFCTVSIHAWMS